MTDRELKKLSRSELLEELYIYANKNVELQLRVDNMKEEVQQLRRESEAEIAAERIRYDKLQKELLQLRQQNLDLSGKLRKRNIELQDAGNIAEATVKVTGIFEQAQKTADLYLQNVRTLAEKQERYLAEMEEKGKQEIQKMGDEATRTCIAMRNQTKKDCDRMRAETIADCEKMKSNAIAQAEQYWEQLSGRLQEFYDAHRGMQELFAGTGIRIPRWQASFDD